MEERDLTLQADKALRGRIEELRQRAAKDALSGLLNRDTMELHIRERLRTMEAGETCALFIMDLDNFKQVNDTLGHPAGDQAIRKSGQILSGLFRASDIVGRLGGDEFAVFLCGNVTADTVRQKAAAICEQVRLVLGDRERINITVSVGAYIAERGQEFEGLYQAADLALYKAKKAGKHRFCVKSREGYQESCSADFSPVNTISLGGLLEEMDSGVALLEMGRPPQVLYVSPSFCRLIGVDIKDFPLPTPLAHLIHPDDIVALERELRRGLEQAAAAESTHRVSLDGGQKWHWWHIRAMRIEYEAPNPVMLVTAVDVTEFKEEEAHQAEQIRRLQTALGQTSKRLWEVDIASGTFHAYSRNGAYEPMGTGKILFPDTLIDEGWIHSDSVARLRTFARELMEGRAQGFGNFAVRSRETGSYSWASVSYRMLFDDAGRAVRAVGVLEVLTPGFGGRSGLFPDQYRLPERLVADLMVRMRANLTLDTVEALWIEGSDLSGQVRETRCSQILQRERQKIFCQGERQEFLDCFDREQLLKLSRAGRHWLCAEYRRVDNSGSIRWVRHVLYLTEDPAAGQVYLFVYLLWLDPDRQMEKAIRAGSLRDGVTRLYRREAVRQIAEDLFSNRRSGNRAVAVVQINGLPPSPGGDGLRYAAAAALSLAVGGSCLIGQYGPDQMIVVFPAVTEKETLHHALEETAAFLRRMLTGEPGFAEARIIVGVQTATAAAAIYSAMAAQAARVCEFWWNAPADTVAFVPENEDWDWTQLPPAEREGEEERVSVFRQAGQTRPLSEREKDVALDCVSAMLSAKTLDASIGGVLRTIGTHYRADRVYTLMLVESRRAVVMTFEWTGTGKRSIQQVVSGMTIDRFPLLKRCMEERSPVFLDRRPAEDGGKEERRPWSFAALPLARVGRVEGFLCIENAREHPEDGALFATLIPLILQQRERFDREDRPTDTTEQLMALPDLRAFTQAVCTLTSEHYSSLGAVTVDIPGFAAVNSSLGFEYGSKMLWHIARTLTDLFGSALLFRTWESEFVAFFPNTTRAVFLGRAGRLRSILQRRYPKQTRVGQAWADGVFTGKRLAREARAAMRSRSAGEDGDDAQLPVHPEDYSSVKEAAQAGRFTVYYQAKVDMRDGSLAGAEALVRAVSDEGAVVPPGRFIEFLEEDGSIRDLDLYVLEQALSQAEQWREADLGVVPMAVNLSRVTLAHPSTLASVLAVQSRFPDIPPPALELEITERGEGISTGQFRELVEKFRSCGLHVALDDFGSKYANLSLFTNVRFETVKLDRSLIAELTSNPMNRTLVRDLVQICRAYGMTCVAEGVETEEQISILTEMGCVYAQGFHFGRPMPAAEFERKYLRGTPSEKITEEKENRP